MKSSLLLVSAVVLLLFSVSKAEACMCDTPSPCEAFGEATAIFIGQMMEGTDKVELRGDTNGKSYEAGTIRFVVEETFKGSVGREVNIFVGNYNKAVYNSCSYFMIRGEKYLVYAYNNNNGRLWTGTCTRTRLLSETGEDLQFLRHLPAAGMGGRLYGHITVETGGPHLRGVTIAITDAENQTTQALTDGEGNFEIRNLKPGKYTVALAVPQYYISDKPKQEVTIEDRSCAKANFWVKPDGLVTGRVFDATYRPVDVTVNLESADPESKSRDLSGYADKEEGGQFEVSGVTPGEYLLYCEIRSKDFQTTQKYYYPGVWDQKAAQRIKAGYGQQVAGYEFQLPPEFAVQLVEGVAVWADGSPAKNVHVVLVCPRDPKTDSFELGMMTLPTRTDTQGRFKLQAFKGLSYWIEARSSKLVPGTLEDASLHSPKHQLLIQEDISNLKIVLSEKGSSGSCGGTLMRKPGASDK